MWRNEEKVPTYPFICPVQLLKPPWVNGIISLFLKTGNKCSDCPLERVAQFAQLGSNKLGKKC